MPKAANRVYFDSSSTTKINDEVLATYKELLTNYYVNSESLYSEGTEIYRMLERSRAAAASLLGVEPSEIIYTSGSSEANSSAVKGVSFACPGKKHIITTQIEHSSLLNACRQMENIFGYDVTYLPVDRYGTVKAEDVLRNLRDDTVLVSVMHVNNETGAVNPIAEIAEIVKKKSHAYFHTDMTQSVEKIPISLRNVDLASMSAHKIEGLKGSGILIRKTHVPFVPLINGGEQEFGLRGGTSNAPVNIVFAKTLRLALENREKYHEHITSLSDHLKEELTKIPGIEMNTPEAAMDGIVNFSYENIPSEVMQNALNQAGFMVSARSTCESHSNNPSYVLTAMGYSDRRASSSIRVSLSRFNTAEETDRFILALKEIIAHYG